MDNERAAAAPGADLRTVLGKVTAVLFAFTAEDYTLSLAELSRRTGLPKGTLHRVAGDLVAVRLLERTPSGYRLGGQLFELGMRASVERQFLEIATPFLEDLYERTHEIVHLGVREGTEVVYVAKIAGHQAALAPSRVGGRMPLYCTAIGKALLAFSGAELFDLVVAAGLVRQTPRTLVAPGILLRQLDGIRESGVSYEYEESAAGINCVAAPVLDRDDKPVAAISITGSAARFRPEKHADAVKAAARGTSAILARRAAARDAYDAFH